MKQEYYSILLRGLQKPKLPAFSALAESLFFSFEVLEAQSALRIRVMRFALTGAVHETTFTTASCPAAIRSDRKKTEEFVQEYIWGKSSKVMQALESIRSINGDVIGFFSRDQLVNSRIIKLFHEFCGPDHQSGHNDKEYVRRVYLTLAKYYEKELPATTFDPLTSNVILMLKRKYGEDHPLAFESIDVSAMGKWQQMPTVPKAVGSRMLVQNSVSATAFTAPSCLRSRERRQKARREA